MGDALIGIGVLLVLYGAVTGSKSEKGALIAFGIMGVGYLIR
jgi:hypothetical protein